MPVNPISSGVAGYVNQVLSGSSTQSGLAAATEEMNESAYTTRQEAAKGDQVAVRKLARMQQQQQAANPTPPQEPGKGELVNQTA